MTQNRPSSLQRTEKYSGFELDVMVYKLIHHVGVTLRTNHKEKLRMGFRLPKTVTLLLVPKEADFLR